MKRDAFKPCVLCGEGVAHDRSITFYRVKLTRLAVNLRAVQAQHGLELMLGHPGLAQIMGPDDDLAEELGDELVALVCDNCAMTRSLVLMELAEILHNEDAKAELDEPEENEEAVET